MSHQTLTLTHESARVARVTFHHPPLGLVDPEVLAELHAVVDELEAGATQVVIFASTLPDYFMNHVDLLRAGEIDRTPDPESGFGPWLHLLHRLEHAPFITVGAVPDAELDGVTRAFAERVAAWDAAAVSTAKSLLTATSAIPAEEYLHGEQAFLGLLVSEQVQQRMPAMFGAGLQQPGDFERDLADASFRAITTVAA